jgi:hypothetical protein
MSIAHGEAIFPHVYNYIKFGMGWMILIEQTFDPYNGYEHESFRCMKYQVARARSRATHIVFFTVCALFRKPFSDGAVRVRALSANQFS